MNESENKISDLERLLLKYPGLIVTKFENNHATFQGPIKVKNIWLNIKLICPNFPRINNFQLQVQQSLNIRSYDSTKLNISTEWSIEEFVENLPTLVGTMETPPNNIFSNINNNFQNNLYAEIVNLYSPSEYEISLNDNCTFLRFAKFSQNEQHFLEVALPSLEILKHSLPSCVNWQDLLGRFTSLPILLEHYKRFVEDLRPFYDHFTDIDELCHVVQPPLPNTKDNWRLFVLKERVFLKVQYSDPFAPLSSMSVHIIGPTSEVTYLRRRYSDGIRDWDGDLDVHKNLLRIFDLCFFPMTPTEDSLKSMQYCNICYCYKLDQGEIPIVSCDNNHCNLIFHTGCLKEWFNTLTDCKIFLDVAFGACPFCKTKLSTSFEEFFVESKNF